MILFLLQPVVGREEGSPMVLGSPGERAELGIQQPHPFILRVQSQPGPAPLCPLYKHAAQIIPAAISRKLLESM